MDKEIIISNKEHFEVMRNAFQKDGFQKMHVLVDFDGTLTTAHDADGKPTPSLISVLRDGEYLTPNYPEKATALYKKYSAVEDDWAAMNEWWTEHAKLLVASGLKKSDIEKIATSGAMKLRPGFVEFANFLQVHQIPLIILSASGLGVDGISLFLKHEGVLYENMHIISNVLEWDEEGRMVALREPIIHSLSKYETMVQDYPVFDFVREKKNVILMGDSDDDIGMVHGFEYDNLVSFGFLNTKVEERLPLYKDIFDVVLTGDADMAFVNAFLQSIMEKK